jgi:PST family polysaccharide transporter
VLRGIAGSAVARVLSLLLRVAGLVLLSRLIAPEVFGSVALAAVVVALLGAMAELGLETATVRRVEEDPERTTSLFHIGLLAASLAWALAWAFADIAAAGFSEPLVAPLLPWLAAALPLRSIGVQHRALLQRRMKWRALHGATLAGQGAGTVSALIVVVATGNGPAALVAQPLVGACVESITLWALCDWRPGRPGALNGAGADLAFGLRLALSSLLTQLGAQMDRVVLGALHGALDVGYYVRASAVLQVPVGLIGSAVNMAPLPALTRIAKEPARWRRALFEVQAGTLAAALFVGVPLHATGPSLVPLLLGSSWAPAGEVLGLLSLAVVPQACFAVNRLLHVSLGRSDRMLRWSFVRIPVLMLACFAGAAFGAEGVATGYAIGCWLLVLPSMAYAARGTALDLVDMLRVARAPGLLTLVSVLLADRLASPVTSWSGLIAQLVVIAVCLAGTFGLMLLVDPAQAPLSRRVARLLRWRRAPRRVDPSR